MRHAASRGRRLPCACAPCVLDAACLLCVCSAQILLLQLPANFETRSCNVLPEGLPAVRIAVFVHLLRDMAPRQTIPSSHALHAHECRAVLGWIEQVEMWEFGSPQGGFDAFLHAWEAPVPQVLPPLTCCPCVSALRTCVCAALASESMGTEFWVPCPRTPFPMLPFYE